MEENGFTNIHFAYQPNPVFQAGHVCSISPSVGTPEDVSTLITLYVSTGGATATSTPIPEPTAEPEQPQTTTVRNYTGISLAEAQAAAATDGLNVTTQEVTRDGQPDGIVLEQSIPPQTETQRGATILLLVNRAAAAPEPQPQPQPEAGGSYTATLTLDSGGDYTGGHYILNVVQYLGGNNRIEKQIQEGDGLAFPTTVTAQGESGVSDGQIVLYELRDGQYVIVRTWNNVPFTAG